MESALCVKPDNPAARQPCNLFKYDVHVHSMETSTCGHMYAADIVDFYHREGYQGIAFTDHFHEVYFQGLPEYKKDWSACVDRFLKGYRVASERAARLGMDLILGIELRCPESLRDTLVFGLDEQFLYDNPYCYELGLEQFYHRFRDELALFAAHPFRWDRVACGQLGVFPELLHGVEVINCNPRHINNNNEALELCRAKPELIRIIGSDVHQPVDMCAAYLGFERRITNSFELRDALLRREFVMGYPSDPAMISEYSE